MNSADKIIDNGTFIVPGDTDPVPPGSLLGMERTVVKQDGTSTWFESPAYDDSAPEGVGFRIPLDIEMGAGHLNANRALRQFRNGEFASDGPDVPVVGWDYGNTTGANDRNVYAFAQPLLAGSFISITLAWDRVVSFATDTAPLGQFNSGDSFQESSATFPTPDSDDLINDLDIYLLPK